MARGFTEAAREAFARLDPFYGRLGGLLLGAAGGWFGMAAGFLLGLMADLARTSWILKSYLRSPEGRKPREALPGLAATSALCLRAPLAGNGVMSERQDAALRRGLFEEALKMALPLGSRPPAGLAILLEAVHLEPRPDLAGLARDLAARGSTTAYETLARFAYAEARVISRELPHERENAIRMALADSGCPAAIARSVRGVSFPEYRDAWEVLGLEPGADQREVRRAYRTLSRTVHPDLAGNAESKAETGREVDGSAAFRELKAAYEYLAARLG